MIDFSFIGQLEGNKTEGYVPDPENSNSGVTIASGFDIGQHQLMSWKKPDHKA
jgi:type VI secretion system secreted protein VgrG